MGPTEEANFPAAPPDGALTPPLEASGIQRSSGVKPRPGDVLLPIAGDRRGLLPRHSYLRPPPDGRGICDYGANSSTDADCRTMSPCPFSPTSRPCA